jgi:hypothetical protein
MPRTEMRKDEVHENQASTGLRNGLTLRCSWLWPMIYQERENAIQKLGYFGD